MGSVARARKAAACLAVALLGSEAAAQAGDPVLLGPEHGPIGAHESVAPIPSGVADVFGNGPWDLFIGTGLLYPYDGTDASGVPRYAEPIDVSPAAGFQVEDYVAHGLFMGAPLAAGSGRHEVSIAIAAGQRYFYETGDMIALEASFADGTMAPVATWRGNNPLASSAMALDTDGDGVGDGTPLDVAFHSFTFPVPEGEWPVTFRLRIDVDGDEEIGIDSLDVRSVGLNGSSSIAFCGFNNSAGELPFTTNINAGALSASTAVTYFGATLAGDANNDFVAVVPVHQSLYQASNLDLGFNGWEGTGFLMAEDTSKDGMPGEVVLEYAPVERGATLSVYSSVPAAAPQASVFGAPVFSLDEGARLDGDDGVIVTVDDPIDSVAQTWMAWINVESFETGSFTATHPHGIINGYEGASMRSVFRLDGGRLQAGWFDGTRFITSTVSDGTVPLGEWIHVCSVNDGASAPRLFINGVARPVTVSAGDPTQRGPLDEFHIGFQHTSGNVRGFLGSIRDARVHAGALSDEQIQAIAQAGPAPEPREASIAPPPVTVVQLEDGGIEAYREAGHGVERLSFNTGTMRWERAGMIELGIPRAIASLGSRVDPEGDVELLASFSGPEDYWPQGSPLYDEGFIPYDGAGMWVGQLGSNRLFSAKLAAGVHSSGIAHDVDKVVPVCASGAAAVNVQGSADADGIIVGGCLGMLYYYPFTAEQAGALGARLHARDESGSTILHKHERPAPVAIVDPSTGLSNLLVGGPDGILFYRALGVNEDGAPVFASPEVVTARGARVFFGSAAALTVSDLDGDGLADLVAGNAAGELLWARNEGPLHAPRFAVPEAILVNAVDGNALRKQAGYRGSIQGPAQGRRGHVGPVAFDWSGDGADDIIYSDISGDYHILVRDTEAPGVAFQRPAPLCLDGLELHTTWRQQPAVTDWNGARGATLVAFDPTDRLRLYTRYDDYNVFDGGLLKLDDGRDISANLFPASGTGRVRLQAVDLDGDGLVDLLAGASDESSIPSPGDGLPANGPSANAQVLFLRNVGSNEAPAFAFPVALALNDGTPNAFGKGVCSPLAFPLTGPGLDLVVADELGELRLIRGNPPYPSLSYWFIH